jgi:peptide/nickel transport system substrate-binding protein
MKRLISVLLLAAMLMILVAGCGSTPEPQTIVETVEVEKTVIETVVETVVETVEVEKEVPVEVVVTPTTVPPPIKEGGPVFIGSGGMTGKHYNPIWLTSNPQFLSFPLILPALTWFDDQVQPVLDLAESVDINEDATVYTFTLPEDAVWSDGEPVTAADVEWTFMAAIHPAVGQSVWAQNFGSIIGASEYQAGEVDTIEGIEIVDDKTITFHLNAPNASFMYGTYLGILPSHILADTPWEEMEQNPYMDAPTVTSGPYDFVEFVPEQYIHLVKKDGYWGKEVTIDEVYIKMFESTATQLAQLEAGELDLALVPPDEMERFEFVEHVDILEAQGIGYYVTHVDFRNEDQIAQLNLPTDEGGKGYSISKTPKPYLQDKRFRQALAYAIDNNAVIQVVAGGYATPIYSSIFGPDWAVNPDLETYDQDVEMAKSLMEEVGVTFDENGTALWDGAQIQLVYLSNTSEEARKLGEVLQQQLGDIGIRLDIKLVTSSAFIMAAINGEGDLIRNAGGRFGADPSVSSLYYTCKAGWSELVIGFCNPDFDELMSQGVATSDSDARQQTYWQASAILNDELPSLFYYTPSVFYGVNKGLKGLAPSADPGYVTWNIENWYLEK